MNRRNFLKTLIGTSALILIGSLKAIAQSEPVQKVIRALKLGKYPGKIKPLGKVTQGDKYLG